MNDFMKLVKQKNATLAANLLDSNIERVIKARVGYAVARDNVIWPEELRHRADTYVGSAGHSVRAAHRVLKDGMTPFKCWIQYANEKVSKLQFSTAVALDEWIS
jgi:hypothetical protein